MRSGNKQREQHVADTAGLAAGYVGSVAADIQGHVDSAEAAGNLAAGALGASYFNNTPGSLGGFLAEENFVRSFNINAATAGQSPSDVWAVRLGSHDLSSPDILTSWGEVLQPKFYATPIGTANALSEMIESADGVINRYAGQTLLAPADQIDRVREILNDRANAALASGDQASADLLHDSLSRLSDHIASPDGIYSSAFSYEDARNGALHVQDGVAPDMGDGFNLADTGGLIGGNSAAAMALSAAIGAGSVLAEATSDLFNGKITAAEMGGRVSHWWQQSGKSTSVQAGGRSVLAGALASMDEIDPSAATALATMAWDLSYLALRAHRGELKPGDAKAAVKQIAVRKLPVILASKVAIAGLGTGPGIVAVVLGQVVISEVVRRHEVQNQCISLLSEMGDEIEKAVGNFTNSAANTAAAGQLAAASVSSKASTLQAAEDSSRYAARRTDTARGLEGGLDSLLNEINLLHMGPRAQ